MHVRVFHAQKNICDRGSAPDRQLPLRSPPLLAAFSLDLGPLGFKFSSLTLISGYDYVKASNKLNNNNV